MLIKNFQAGTIQDALSLVRREFGQEAVILKTDIIKDNGRRLFSVTAAKRFSRGFDCGHNYRDATVNLHQTPGPRIISGDTTGRFF